MITTRHKLTRYGTSLAFVLGVYPQPLLELVQQAGLQLIG